MRRQALLWMACFLALGSEALADEAPVDLFARAKVALERGDANAAIGDLELLADRGFVHPDASFNRAVAYVQRAESPQAERGDLGRAAAALEEATLLRPGDETAATALERVREEIARRRAKQGAEPILQRTAFDRAIVGLASENAWAVGALLGSTLLAAGLGMWLWVRQRVGTVAGPVVVTIGSLLLFGCGWLTWKSRRIRLDEHPAVVVAPEARLLDATGAALSLQAADGSRSVPEGASVRVLATRGGMAHILWGAADGWVRQSQLRQLARPGDSSGR